MAKKGTRFQKKRLIPQGDRMDMKCEQPTRNKSACRTASDSLQGGRSVKGVLEASGGDKMGEAFCGCALAGGQSSRMGSDKAMLRLAASHTLLDATMRLLGALCPEAHVATAPGRPYPPYRCVYDAAPGLGPIGGIISSLHAARKEGFAGVLALACDLPLMRAELLSRLIQAFPDWAAAAFFQNPQSGKLEMLAGIYHLRALPFLEKAVAAKKFGLYAALPPPLVCKVALSHSEAPAFANCNTPAQAERAKRKLTRLLQEASPGKPCTA